MASGFWECQILISSSASMQTLPSDIIKTSTDDERCFNAVVDVVAVNVVDVVVVVDSEVMVV